eukprot:1139111-Pelagomonas_calceolata.AAC.2
MCLRFLQGQQQSKPAAPQRGATKELTAGGGQGARDGSMRARLEALTVVWGSDLRADIQWWVFESQKGGQLHCEARACKRNTAELLVSSVVCFSEKGLLTKLGPESSHAQQEHAGSPSSSVDTLVLNTHKHTHANTHTINARMHAHAHAHDTLPQVFAAAAGSCLTLSILPPCPSFSGLDDHWALITGLASVKVKPAETSYHKPAPPK